MSAKYCLALAVYCEKRARMFMKFGDRRRSDRLLSAAMHWRAAAFEPVQVSK